MNDYAKVTTPVLLDEKELRTLLVNYMDFVDEYGHYGLEDDEYNTIINKLREALKSYGPHSAWNADYRNDDNKQ